MGIRTWISGERERLLRACRLSCVWRRRSGLPLGMSGVIVVSIIDLLFTARVQRLPGNKARRIRLRLANEAPG
jgi:hypothetical protein